MLTLLTKILKLNLKNSKESESLSKKTRICDKCGEEKPLNADNFQKVKHFREGYSYYCNECSKPKSRE
jgi:predicted SprT family Zn-dependent metalloprotease